MAMHQPVNINQHVDSTQANTSIQQSVNFNEHTDPTNQPTRQCISLHFLSILLKNSFFALILTGIVEKQHVFNPFSNILGICKLNCILCNCTPL